MHYAYGYGGQMLYIVPSLRLTVVLTSDERNPAARSGYRNALHGMLEEIVAAVQAHRGDAPTAAIELLMNA